MRLWFFMSSEIFKSDGHSYIIDAHFFHGLYATRFRWFSSSECFHSLVQWPRNKRFLVNIEMRMIGRKAGYLVPSRNLSTRVFATMTDVTDGGYFQPLMYPWKDADNILRMIGTFSTTMIMNFLIIIKIVDNVKVILPFLRKWKMENENDNVHV